MRSSGEFDTMCVTPTSFPKDQIPGGLFLLLNHLSLILNPLLPKLKYYSECITIYRIMGVFHVRGGNQGGGDYFGKASDPKPVLS